MSFGVYFFCTANHGQQRGSNTSYYVDLFDQVIKIYRIFMLKAQPAAAVTYNSGAY